MSLLFKQFVLIVGLLLLGASLVQPCTEGSKGEALYLTAASGPAPVDHGCVIRPCNKVRALVLDSAPSGISNSDVEPKQWLPDPLLLNFDPTFLSASHAGSQAASFRGASAPNEASLVTLRTIVIRT